jgi:hypothetical protein
MPYVKLRASILTVALALVAAGCGTSSKTTSTASSSASSHGSAAATHTTSASTPSSPTAASSDPPFTVKAEAICERLNDAIAAEKPTGGGVREIKRIVPRRVALESASVEELSRLTAPASVAGAWRRMLAYRRTLARELAELLSDARHNDLTAIRALTASKQRMHRRLAATAAAAGFKVCARVG